MEWQGEWTPTRLIVTVLAISVTWNIVGNLFLPSAAYIPANLAIAAVLVVIARRAGLNPAQLGLARADLGRGVVIGFATFLLIGLVIGLGLVVPALEEVFQDDSVGDASGFDRWFVPLVRIPLGTAVYEEVVFRSVLLGAFLVTMRRTWHAVAVTSVLFGLWHIVPAIESAGDGAAAVVGAVVGTVFVTALGGVLFGVLRTWSRSVVAPILAHTATNSLAFLAALLAIEVLD